MLAQLLEKWLVGLIVHQKLFTTSVRAVTIRALRNIHCVLTLWGATEPMSTLMNKLWLWFLLREVRVRIKHSVILNTISVDTLVRHMLSTESTNDIKLLEFGGVFVNKFCPFFHLVSSLLIEFILVAIVFLLYLLLQLPDHVIFKLQDTTLLFIVFNQKLSFGKLSR